MYRSIVYPDVTEKTSLFILEKESDLHYVKLISRSDTTPYKLIQETRRIGSLSSPYFSSVATRESFDEISKAYEIVFDAGMHASCIKLAEAAKVIENPNKTSTLSS